MGDWTSKEWDKAWTENQKMYQKAIQERVPDDTSEEYTERELLSFILTELRRLNDYNAKPKQFHCTVSAS